MSPRHSLLTFVVALFLCISMKVWWLTLVQITRATCGLSKDAELFLISSQGQLQRFDLKNMTKDEVHGMTPTIQDCVNDINLKIKLKYLLHPNVAWEWSIVHGFELVKVLTQKSVQHLMEYVD